MAKKIFPQSGLPIRKTVELLPAIFQTSTNDKFMSAVVDPLVQPGVLEKTVGYVGRRYGKTYTGSDVYLNSDNTLRSRYQLEPGVTYNNNQGFYDYLDLKNQLKFFGNKDERDDLITSQEHYSWNPPIDWDKFINYREYYWEPSGPPPVAIAGQAVGVISNYKVSLGVGSTFIFTPDGYTNNPTLTLFRGQTYNFKIDAPNQGFIIRTNYDIGSFVYQPTLPYTKGQVVIYDNKLWKAKVDIAVTDGSSFAIDIDSQDWEYIEPVSQGQALDYNKGITNNGTQNGTVTFEVPFDCPDVLYYQSLVDVNMFGQLIIEDIESNTSINVDKEIVGKSQYTSSNGIVLSSGLVIEFTGNVFPSKYSKDTWLVEGVGTEITLTRFNDLVVPSVSVANPEILFDNSGFDTEPFDDASEFAGTKDYILVKRDSIDKNPWSRYNRWFHRNVLEYAYKSRGQDFSATETARAKRPIIEFGSNLKLFEHGSIAKDTVDYVDDFTTDVFSNIEGSIGYNIDGEFLFDGARVLVVADTDILANNKIFQVQFITHNGQRQIHLKETADSESIIGQGVLVRRGNSNKGLMYHFNGTNWIKSQKKITVNQPPLFDAFDENEVSFANAETYPVSTFLGTKIFSYKIGSSIADSELGFSLSYLNIDNVGDIVFEWNWEIDSFYYTLDQSLNIVKLSSGYFKNNLSQSYDNGWTRTNNDYLQPIIDSVVVAVATNSISLNSVDWKSITDTTPLTINFYLNGIKFTDTYTRTGSNFVFNTVTFKEKDVVSVKIITTLSPDQGYYEIPVGLEKNPLNQNLTTFTLGQAVDHISSAIEFKDDFVGVIPGPSNLRDIANYQRNSKRFLKHSGLTPLAISLLCDKSSNIIKSIQYAKKSYTDFKNNFLNRSLELDFNDNVANFVDDIISDLTKTKTENSPFADSDMIGAGAYTSVQYKVDDPGIRTFSLTTKFSLNELSRKAVYAYINEQQLLVGSDYVFDQTFGFITILTELVEGDFVEIREYVSTAVNHIPATPTSMGLYKKYTPMKFIDDTYAVPKEVIQGHDGSITVAYDDFRDDLLLELEYRIYNNIKREYNRSIFDIDSVIGGYYNSNSVYSKSQLDSIVVQEFLKWVQNTNIDYTSNSYFDSENSFTYTYSNMSDPTGKQNLPGYWRGVYSWFYDTDRPHRCPWEMLGFSEKPTWWEDEYGPAPYTKGNLLLWEDLRDGIIRQGDRAGTYTRYMRPSLLSHIPVDLDGNLLSPLDSGLAQDFTLINNKGSFTLGDVSPVEYAWRSSSEWPFALMMAMSLLKPFEFITDNFELSKTKINKLDQTVNADTNTFSTPANLRIPNTSTSPSVGLVKYLAFYLKSKGFSIPDFEEKIKMLNVSLSSRLSGFVDKEQQKYLLDSKSPKSTTSSIFIPPENYDIIFNVSSPISSIAYSGVILEKVEGGWTVSGYDDIQPYFNYYEARISQSDPLITVGGVSEKFLTWVENKNYDNGQLVQFKNDYYRTLKTHNSGSSFDSALWKKLPNIPVVGGVEAFRRKTFNTLNISKISYGTRLTSIQSVVDFLLGYDLYLTSVGFTFDRYDPTIQAAQDWLTAVKEFMYWSKHNWSIGSLISLSPGAEKVNISVPVGVADNLLDSFYEYQVLKTDGKVLPLQFINVNRDFQNITIETINTTEGIYYLKVHFVLKEHVVIFSDRTVFNDVIYDKATGYRQERIRTQGFRTIDWDGDYTSPGFLFDNVDIQAWKPFTDYRSGDIVSYRSYNWTSLVNQLGTETFVDTQWTKLDSTPEKQLIANFDYKINQFEDYYEASADGVGNSQRMLARHTIGYQTRDYLQNLAEDPVTQFQIYQGFIKEKGSANAITKVFNKLSVAGSSGVTLNEEWAFKVGEFGGTDQLTESEITLYKNKLVINPQPIIISGSTPAAIVDQYYRVTKTDFTIDNDKFNLNVNPTTENSILKRVAGYVKSTDVDFILKTRDDILNLDIDAVYENDHLWITFDQYSWTVLRYNESPIYVISTVEKLNTLVTITLTRPHLLQVDDIVGIKKIENLTGFFKIVSVEAKSLTVEVSATAQEPGFDGSSAINLSVFSVARATNYDELDLQTAALLKTGSKLWIDNNLGKWEVVQKKKQFTAKELVDPGIVSPEHLGTKVVYSEKYKQALASIPSSGYVMSYVEVNGGLGVKQVITPPEWLRSSVLGSFGTQMAISPDSRWLVVGSPFAGAVPSYYRGVYNPLSSYIVGSVVLFDNVLWEAVNTIVAGDGSTIDLFSGDWKVAESITATETGYSGFSNQGVITIYEYSGQRWNLKTSLVSPRPSANEKFGSGLSISQEGDTYFLAVSAVGALSDTGRVYLYSSTGSTWTHVTINNSNFALPQQIATSGDGSSLGQITEIIKTGDEYGASISMSTDGQILAIGAPNSDGIYFENYRGWWRNDTTYSDQDVVLFEGNYFKLADPRDHTEDWDSTLRYTDVGTEPSQYPWESIGDSSTSPSGKVFVYKRDDVNQYQLIQTIDAASLVLFDDTPSKVDSRAIETSVINNAITVKSTTGMVVNMPIIFTGTSFGGVISGTTYYIKSIIRPGVNGAITISKTFTGDTVPLISASGSMAITAGGTPDINIGDQFGFSIKLSAEGTTLVISSPTSDINFQNQGSAYVFTTGSTTDIEYRLKQKLESYESYPNEYFGQAVSVSSTADRIIVGAKNTPFKVMSSIDAEYGTVFDQGKTRFVERNGYAGAVYVYERKNSNYILVEKLETDLSPYESFGYTVDCTDSVIVVGSPDYRAPAVHLTTVAFDGALIGTVRIFTKDETVNSWEVLGTQQSLVDIEKIKSISLYDTEKNVKIQDLDFVDHAKLKILNIAEQEIKFKTMYDPAVYSIGTDEQTVDTTTAWAESHVGELWWDISAVKWKYYEQGDIAYRNSNWNSLAEGASVDVYEWVETTLLPSDWSVLADTNEGLSVGISGQPIHIDDTVYTIKELYSPTTGLLSGTLYYYWVRNKTLTPKGNPGRRISSSTVSSYIANPAGSGTAFIALIESDKFLAYNFNSIVSSDTASLNIQFTKNNLDLNEIHREYQLLTEGVADSLPVERLEAKWIDSLVGTDISGNSIPDTRLSAKQKYGLSFRPRQSMFVNRNAILKTIIGNVNTILEKEAFANVINFDNLNLVDQTPSPLLNLYDVSVDTDIDLTTVGTVRIRQAILNINIINGQVDTVDIIDSGQGYRVSPPIQIIGDGEGATATATIDNQGRITAVNVVTKGKKYSSAIAKVRQFSTLVRADSTTNNFWSIYAWDDTRGVFYRSQSQAFDTTRYWSYIDWWQSGFSANTRIVAEISNIFEEQKLKTIINDLIRVKEYGSGGWAVFQKVSDTGVLFSDRFNQVGRENGTIKFNDALYNTALSGIGYDNVQSFDIQSYDIENSKELRNIFTAIKTDILIGDYAVEWNKLFFTSVRYAFTEQSYIDWAFKTSFLNATHDVGLLQKHATYRNDNLESYQDYIDEVKPYRTTVREYISKYINVENSFAASIDFDVPPRYSVTEGKALPVTLSDETAQQYPWKWWTDNYGYSILSIEVANPGSNYIQPPNVLIEGNGVGAQAKAYISNGSVSGIKVISSGTGFTAAPKVTLVGGNAASTDIATAVAIIGDTKSRTFNLGIKFDRISKDGLYSELAVIDEQIIPNGYSATFELNFAPAIDKTKIKILKNNQLVLNNEYSVVLFKSTVDEYSLLKGKIIFNVVPQGPNVATGDAGDQIFISYEKNDQLLDSVNRIQKYYSPTAGMKGKELSQLMTGVDFGGVQIQGTTFDVTGGWDALPWFTDNWDSVESSSDFYVVCEDGTTNVTLPFIPAAGQEINVYLKRAGTSRPQSKNTIQTLGEADAPVISYETEIADQPTIRIDDPFFFNQVDSSTSINPNAQMPTFIGDGFTDVIEIGIYIQTETGDTLIFRTAESDGSVTITDDNLLDTKLSGGTLNSDMSGAYLSATGVNAQDISIDGGKFNSPDQVPAPEENIPGQVLDSVSIKVFNTASSGVAPLQTRILTGNASTRLYDIGLKIFEAKSLLVYVDKIRKSDVTDYIIDYKANTIIFNTAPPAGAVIELISFGIGGTAILDYQEFTADGTTSLFLTNADFIETGTVSVTVDGIYQDTGFINSTGVVDTEEKTLIRFGTPPEFNSIIKIVSVGKSALDQGIVRVVEEVFEFEGSTRSFEMIDYYNAANSALPESSVIVEIDGRILNGVDTVYAIYDGITSSYTIGIDPEQPIGAILSSNIFVYINNVLQVFVQDYIYDGNLKQVIITAPMDIGDTVKIENNFEADYSITDNILTINSDIQLLATGGPGNEYNDIIKVTRFSEYPELKMVSDEFVGGKVKYYLGLLPLDIRYVWVYKTSYNPIIPNSVVSSKRLVQDVDYRIGVTGDYIYLTEPTSINDKIKVVLFGSKIYRFPSAYEIHKDMLNIFSFKRYSITEVKLAQSLNYYDQEIVVTDGSDLSVPIASRNIPGIVLINNERIEYLTKNGNILSQLRRGSQGTAIAEIHNVNSIVIDVGATETIPYKETQNKTNFISDGSSLLIGPLEFIPTKSTRTWDTAAVTTIPEEYGPCDEFEVFAAGRRLQKDSLQVYSEIKGASSTSADIVIEAEFSVDGQTPYIRLTSKLPAGTRISVIRKVGSVWYEKGATTASSGITLVENNNPIATFIAKKTTLLPE
jgi:hypothetical protein